MALTSFADLRFPSNLGTNLVPNYICFSPQKVQYGGTKGLTGGANGVSHPGNLGTSLGGLGSVGSIGGALGGGLSNLAGNIQASVDGIAQTASSIANIADQAARNIKAGAPVMDTLQQVVGQVPKAVGLSLGNLDNVLAGALQTAQDKLNTAGTISLYLPQNLETNSSVDYETAALGAIGKTAAEIGQNMEKLKASDAAQKAVGALIQQAVSSGNQRAIIGVATQEVTNNFSFQVFNSVLHRQFAYEFRMMAKSSAETATIKKICDMFLWYMLPARKETGNVGMYEVPCQWQIQYKRQGAPLRFHQQPKACFLTSVDVGYGGDAGNATYNDGGPMEVTLRLQFVEVEPLYRESGGSGAMGALASAAKGVAPKGSVNQFELNRATGSSINTPQQTGGYGGEFPNNAYPNNAI